MQSRDRSPALRHDEYRRLVGIFKYLQDQRQESDEYPVNIGRKSSHLSTCDVACRQASCSTWPSEPIVMLSKSFE